MKIVYLTWGEIPRNNGVFKSQVLALCDNLSAKIDIRLISALPIIYRDLPKNLTTFLKPDIKYKFLEIILVPFSQFSFFPTKYNIKLIRSFFNARIFRALRHASPNVIHCRSYSSMVVASEYRKRFDPAVKLVFDPRGNLPEEIAYKKSLSETSRRYRYLKKLEDYLMNESDVVICVSDTMNTYFRDHYPNIRRRLIYLIGGSTVQKSRCVKKSNVFAYVGSIGESTWHSNEALVNLIENIKGVKPDSSFKVVTQSNTDELKRKLDSRGITEVAFFSFSSIKEYETIMSDVTYGLIPFNYDSDEFPKNIVGYTLLGTKMVEYANHGLISLINENCGGAVELAKKYGVGLGYNSNTNFVDFFKQVDGLKLNFSELNRATSLENIADSYLQVYRCLR